MGLRASDGTTPESRLQTSQAYDIRHRQHVLPILQEEKERLRCISDGSDLLLRQGRGHRTGELRAERKGLKEKNGYALAVRCIILRHQLSQKPLYTTTFLPKNFFFTRLPKNQYEGNKHETHKKL
jgi:hypothetical protein